MKERQPMPSMHRVVRVFVLLVLCPAALAAQPQRWSEQKAADWYKRQPWLVGSNYVPAYAINELEMWQADTFDPKRIDLELGWADGLGMNTMRVFLHDLLWQQDAEGFKQAPRHVPGDRREARDPADVRPVRLGVGSRLRSSASSAPRAPACTTPAGCRAPAPRRSPTPPNTRGSRPT